MTSTPPDPSAGLLDDRYRLGERLGTGGVAEVFRAVDERLARPVAVKLFRGDVADQLGRHEEEMRTLARLDHPSLVTVFDAGSDTVTGRPYLVMQLIEGTTLADELRIGPLPQTRVATVGASLADALGYVHAQGLVHRDVKPANVLLSRVDGRVALADFGIARLVDSAHVTRTGDVLGTPAYFSPEQISGVSVGPATDVYALGLVLLESLTGQRAYDGPPMEAAVARLSRQPDVPTTLPPGWRDLLAAMTAREPAERPGAVVVADRLRQLLDGGASTVAMTALTVPAPAPTSVLPPATTVAPVAAAALVADEPVRRRRRWWIPVLLVLVLLAAGGAAYGLLRGSSSGTSCAAGSPALPSPLESDVQALEQTSCASGHALTKKGASELRPKVQGLRQAAAGTSVDAVNKAVSTLLTEADLVHSQGRMSASRQKRLSQETATLLQDYQRGDFASPSASPSDTPTDTPTASPAQTVTVTPTTVAPTEEPTTSEPTASATLTPTGAAASAG